MNLNLTPETIIATIMDRNKTILQYIRKTSVTFALKYQENYKISSSLSALVENNVVKGEDTTTSRLFSQTNTRTTTNTGTPSSEMVQIDYIWNILVKAFVEPWELDTNMFKDNTLNLELRKIVNFEGREKAKEDAKLHMNQ